MPGVNPKWGGAAQTARPVAPIGCTIGALATVSAPAATRPPRQTCAPLGASTAREEHHMSEPMTPDPNEVLTVALTAEQAEHVRERLLADFASGLQPLARATRHSPRDASRLRDVSSHAATY